MKLWPDWLAKAGLPASYADNGMEFSNLHQAIPSGNTNTYYQNIAGVNQMFVSSGNSQTAALRLARVISRSQNDVLGGLCPAIEALRRQLHRRHDHSDTGA